MDNDISRQHCRIEWIGKDIQLTDLSRNGTFYGTQRITDPVILSDGDHFSIGPWKIELKNKERAVPIQTAIQNRAITNIISIDQATSHITKQFIEFKIHTPGQSNFTVRTSASHICIGHHASCDICIADPFISREHCQLSMSLDQLFLTDLNSTNGTFVKNERIHDIALQSTGSFSIGKSIIQYVKISEDTTILPSTDTCLGALIGQSSSMRKIFSIIQTVAPSTSAICIQGPSGSGKEVIAREIHNSSHRKNKPFIAVNCAAIPSELIESHLFGHERGAFTGAIERSKGYFEQADGGTLFLDEIGDMPLKLQSRLLRVLEDHTFTRLGSSHIINTDFRLITATHQNLRQMNINKQFREDLFFRLMVLPIYVPSLASRKQDIELLVHHFTKTLSPTTHIHITASALNKLKNHNWPGNVRELKNTIERTIALYPNERIIDAHHIDIIAVSGHSNISNLKEIERLTLLDALRANKGNVSKTSLQLGISRGTTNYKINAYRINVNDFRDNHRTV